MLNEKEQEYLNKYMSDNISEEVLDEALEKSHFLNNLCKDFRALLLLIKDNLNGKFELSLAEKTLIIGSIIYFVTPIDAIPDLLPVGGYVDDVAVITYTLKKCVDTINNYKKFARLI